MLFEGHHEQFWQFGSNPSPDVTEQSAEKHRCDPSTPQQSTGAVKTMVTIKKRELS